MDTGSQHHIIKPGWYPDNQDNALERWWDGQQWTHHAKYKETKKRSKRDAWVTTCLVWAGIWTVIGIFVWPLLPLAAISALMIMIPVGVNE